jgi:hypothetical protein
MTFGIHDMHILQFIEPQICEPQSYAISWKERLANSTPQPGKERKISSTIMSIF